MSQTVASFETLRAAIHSLYANDQEAVARIYSAPHVLVLHLPSDIAAFAILNGSAESSYNSAYQAFKSLYRENTREWDARTLSFVACRQVEHSEEDRFYASIEHDPLFCRKYVIRASSDVGEQGRELRRLPFLPLPNSTDGKLTRPRSAQDLLQLAGLSASLARKFVESGHRSPENIATDLRDASERVPETLKLSRDTSVELTKPRAFSRMTSVSLEGFRAYRDKQSFDLDASVVVLYGPNGLGKTSVFDAIDYACTGRIGRLCRSQKRTQGTFEKIATHLDLKPGTGRVSLGGVSTEGDGSSSTWALDRSTGDWTHAVLNGLKVDRKEVLTRITHSQWSEANPRQQTLETLFRATHLFGQDDQELLLDFRRKSIIPEAFVSEMLALQDYSQGIEKSHRVADHIKILLNGCADAISAAQKEKAECESTIATLGLRVGDNDPTPAIDVAMAQLHELWITLKLPDLPLPPSEREPLQEWCDLLRASLASIENHLAKCQTMRESFGTVERLRIVLLNMQAQLAGAEVKLSEAASAEQQAHSLTTSIEADLSTIEQRRAQKESTRNSLRTLQQNDQANKALLSRLEQLKATRNSVSLERQSTEAIAIEAETLVASYRTTALESARNVATVKRRAEELRSLVDEVALYNEDVQRHASAQLALETLSDRRALVESSRAAVDGAIREMTALRDGLLPEYNSVVSRQAELDRLLDALQSLLESECCPLCGTKFDSLLAVQQQIQTHRGDASVAEVTVRFSEVTSSLQEATSRAEGLREECERIQNNIEELQAERNTAHSRMAEFQRRVESIAPDISRIAAEELQAHLDSAAVDLGDQQRRADAAAEALRKAEGTLSDAVTAKTMHEERLTQVLSEIGTAEGTCLQLQASLNEYLKNRSLGDLAGDLADATGAVESIAAEYEKRKADLEEATRAKDAATRHHEQSKLQLASATLEIEATRRELNEYSQRLREIGLDDGASADEIYALIDGLESSSHGIRRVVSAVASIEQAFLFVADRLRLNEHRVQLDAIDERLLQLTRDKEDLLRAASGCSAVSKVLSNEREGAIDDHIKAYGPLITNIQQRLRSVYGFGGVHLEAKGGEASVHVEWRRRSVSVPPTDFFSDSQKQILMLSIFLAGGLRQNWSGFAPVLLDDPVTHFDDLNAYGFIELVRGIVSAYPNEWQFVISTCEERLFTLMRKKFARLPGGANFYEFLGLSDAGPIIERR